MKRQALNWTMGGFFLLLLVAALWPSAGSHFEPPKRHGPPLLVLGEGTPQLWLMLKQEEQRQIRVGGGSRSIGRMVTETRYHFRLQAHDSISGQPAWKKELLTLTDKQAGHNAQGRLLGRDGEVIWIFLNNQVLALSARDGSTLADRARLEQVNPDLHGLLPPEPGFYTFVGQLVITTADARQVRIRAGDFVAEPYVVTDSEAFRRANFQSSTWNGGYRTADFLVRHLRREDGWFGLYSDAEADDAGKDGWGDNIKDSTQVLNEGTLARRGFWTASIGRTEEFSEGSHERLLDLTRLPGTRDYLQGGLMKQTGTQAAWSLADPPGALVLHRTRVDAEGRLVLSRVGAGFVEVWRALLPLDNLGNRWELGDRLLLYGDTPGTEPGLSQWSEHVVVVDLASGASRAWNVTAEAETTMAAATADVEVAR